MIKLNIANDFSETPGARKITDGDWSGELFRNKFLEPKFVEALKNKKKLCINLDGGYGYATSFLEEAFGGLARKYGSEKVLETLMFESLDEIGLPEEIESYISNAKKQ